MEPELRGRNGRRERYLIVPPGIPLEADEEEEGDLKVQFAYDYMGRRVEKKVSTWDDVGEEWDLTLHRKFVWGGTGGSSASGGWLMLLERKEVAGEAADRGAERLAVRTVATCSMGCRSRAAPSAAGGLTRKEPGGDGGAVRVGHVQEKEDRRFARES